MLAVCVEPDQAEANEGVDDGEGVGDDAGKDVSIGSFIGNIGWTTYLRMKL